MRVVAVLLVCWLCADTYTVSRNVRNFGAKGDGVTDDSLAIITALTQGRADNPNDVYPNAVYSSSTKTPAFVYFPPGVYKVTQTLPLVYYTQMVGSNDNMPTIKYVSPDEAGHRVLEVAGSWYPGVNQNNFYRQIRNVVVDMTECPQCTGVHWQVAQATSINNVVFRCAVGSKCQGMWMENGSGGFISDIIFEGGLFGMWVGNQQFTSRNITILNTSVAGIYLNWDWGWTFKGLNVTGSPAAVQLGMETGTVTIIDSSFTNVGVVVETNFGNGNGAALNSVVLDNVAIFTSQSSQPVVTNNGVAALTATNGQRILTWVQGHVWQNGGNSVTSLNLGSSSPQRPAMLTDASGSFFQRSRPMYSAYTDVTTLGVANDGTTDVTVVLQRVLNNAAGSTVLFFPHGTYLISSTVDIPLGTRMFGQAWSVLMCTGKLYSNASTPAPFLRMGGEAGGNGTIELSDFLISTQGPVPGATLVEWNAHDPVGMPGACGMWDVHFRIGGAIGTNIRPSNCPAGDGTNAPASACSGSFNLMYIPAPASCYLENVWGWVADHDIDAQSQINVYNARGLLCESQGPVWMYGTAMEHSALYNYNIWGARNIFMGMIQTEVPYYQPSPNVPFNPGMHLISDPTYCTTDPRCKMAYGMAIQQSSDIFVYGTGHYSFFNVWDQSCLRASGGPACSVNIATVTDSQRVHLFALNTYGSTTMLTNATYAMAAANSNTFCSTGIINMNYF